MNALIVPILAIAVAFWVWQRAELSELREKEVSALAALAKERAKVQTSSDIAPIAPSAILPKREPVSDERFMIFMADVNALTAAPRSRQQFRDVFPRRNDLCDTLRSLTTKQLRSLTASLDKDKAHNFLFTAGNISPRTVLEVMYQMRSESGETGLPGHAPNAFEHWFHENPKALLEWACERGFPDGFDDACKKWATASAAVLDPTPENMAKLFPPKDMFTPAAKVIANLPNPEAQLTFFRSLYAATGGVSDGAGFSSILSRFTEVVPFAQAAHIADSVPHFLLRDVAESRTVGVVNSRANSSLRYFVAAMSRDGSVAARWNWLVARPEDRPTELQTFGLIESWCQRDYGEVAAWIRSLPLSAERDTFRKAMLRFEKEEDRRTPRHDGKLRASEWEAQ